MDPRMGNPVGKELHLRMDHMEEVRVVAHALSSDVRLRILAMIGATSMNVNEIARELGAPVSTTALNIQVLERAGLVSCEMQPGTRGAMKMCVRGIDRVHISLSPTPRGERRVWECEMPVGCYALVGGVQPTCGMANRNCKMNADDDPRSFYRPNHFEADLLWMRAGFVEYHFPPADVPLNRVDFLELSFEACSETLGHNNRWPSSIYVEINGQRLGVWHCEGDFGGRRGQLNPPWWDATNTQFGQLKTWRVDRHRTYLDGDALSNVNLEKIHLNHEQDHIRVRIGVQEEEGHTGGMNLFGDHFGDFPQGLILRAGYYTA